MHVRREARLVDDHRCGVELSLAPAPKKSSQKNRPDAPYEGLPPNRWMPGTNAKCPRTPAPVGHLSWLANGPLGRWRPNRPWSNGHMFYGLRTSPLVAPASGVATVDSSLVPARGRVRMI